MQAHYHHHSSQGAQNNPHGSGAVAASQRKRSGMSTGSSGAKNANLRASAERVISSVLFFGDMEDVEMVPQTVSPLKHPKASSSALADASTISAQSTHVVSASESQYVYGAVQNTTNAAVKLLSSDSADPRIHAAASTRQRGEKADAADAVQRRPSASSSSSLPIAAATGHGPNGGGGGGGYNNYYGGNNAGGRCRASASDMTAAEREDIHAVVSLIKSLQRSYSFDSMEKIVRDRVSSLLGYEGKRIVRRVDVSIDLHNGKEGSASATDKGSNAGMANGSAGSGLPTAAVAAAPHAAGAAGGRSGVHLHEEEDEEESVYYDVGGSDSVSKEMQLLRLRDLMRLEGYDVDVYQSRAAKGSNKYRDCLRHLTHTFLGIQTRAGEMPLIVDPAFRQQFEIARASERYKVVLRALPNTFVGRLSDLKKIVGLIVSEIKRSFEVEQMSTPPWRRQEAFMSKWTPMVPLRADAGGDAHASVATGALRKAQLQLHLV